MAKRITADEVLKWMQHCDKMQDKTGTIHPGSYTQFRGYAGLGAAAKKLGYIAREPVLQKDKSYRVCSVWKLKEFDIGHAKLVLQKYHEDSSASAARRYTREHPVPDPVQPEEPVETFTKEQVDDLLAAAIDKAKAEATRGLQVPLPLNHQVTGPFDWTYALGPGEVEAPRIEEQMLSEQRQTNALLIQLLKVWQR